MTNYSKEPQFKYQNFLPVFNFYSLDRFSDHQRPATNIIEDQRSKQKNYCLH